MAVIPPEVTNGGVGRFITTPPSEFGPVSDCADHLPKFQSLVVAGLLAGFAVLLAFSLPW